MRYSDYDKKVFSVKNLIEYKKHFEKDIAEKQKELEEFIDRGVKRINTIKEYESNKEYCILGSTHKLDGKKKEILLILRYPDNTQQDERYVFDKIADMRNKLSELKAKYSGVDWSQFQEEI